MGETLSAGPSEAAHGVHPQSQVRAILLDTELCPGCPGRCSQGKGWLLFLKPSTTARRTEAESSNTRAPAGAGPAPTRARTSTVNALQLKSYFSKGLFVSSSSPAAVALTGGLHAPRGLSERQPLGDVLRVSPQCPAPSCGSRQPCRADRLHRAPGPHSEMRATTPPTLHPPASP